jgi:hypothetical protein
MNAVRATTGRTLEGHGTQWQEDKDSIKQVVIKNTR